MKTTLILGAGFSKNSNIPVMSEIPKLLIENTGADFDAKAAAVIKRFFEDIFGYDGTDNLPPLDDILTCIDISTKSGHHLGIGYSPLRLEAVRKLVVYRIFSLLERPFTYSEDVKLLVRKLSDGKDPAGYVVLNWDNVLEKYLAQTMRDRCIEYCNGGLNWEEGGEAKEKKPVKVIKLHGSSNWLYCDSCRSLFNDSRSEIPVVKRTGFRRNELDLFEEFAGLGETDEVLGDVRCKICSNRISSHIATLSYKKSFRVNTFPDIWNEAEKELAGSDKWVFIGYSLPDADYEFKHLLKIAEHKLRHVRKSPLQIQVVLLEDSPAIEKYRSFFGSRISRIFDGGIKDYLEHGGQ